MNYWAFSREPMDSATTVDFLKTGRPFLPSPFGFHQAKWVETVWH